MKYSYFITLCLILSSNLSASLIPKYIPSQETAEVALVQDNISNTDPKKILETKDHTRFYVYGLWNPLPGGGLSIRKNVHPLHTLELDVALASKLFCSM